MELKEKEYTNCYRMLDDIILTLREYGGCVYVNITTPVEINFSHSNLEKKWKIKIENVPKESAFLKYLVDDRHIKATLDALNYTSKDVVKPTFEEIYCRHMKAYDPTIVEKKYADIFLLLKEAVEHINQNGGLLEIKDIPKRLLFGFYCKKTDTLFAIGLKQYGNTMYKNKEFYDKWLVLPEDRMALCEMLNKNKSLGCVL